MTPKLSVITACYEHGRYLLESAESVLRQTERDLELIIVVDGSTDDSLAIAMGIAHDDARVRVFHNRTNRGLASSQNRGIAEALAPWVLKNDADDYIAPSYVDEILQAAAADSRRNVIFSPCQHFGHQHHVYRYPVFEPLRMADVFMIPGPAAFRRDVWAAVGGYDETMRSAEDWDFYIRAQRAVGLVPYQLDEPRWFYRMHGGPRASRIGMARLPELQAYWRGHTRESVLARSRSWGQWCETRGVAA